SECTTKLCQYKTLFAWELIDAQQDAGVVIGVGGGIGLSAYEMAEALATVVLNPEATYNGLKALLANAAVREQLGNDIIASYDQRLNRLSQAREDAGWEGSITNGVESGRLALEVVTAIQGVTALGKTIAKLPAGSKKALTSINETVQKGLSSLQNPALVSSNTITDLSITWGKGISKQGFAYEDYLEQLLPAGSRLPANFKTFDYYDQMTGIATSAKTLDTGTAARIAKPVQIFSTLKRNIDAAANFDNYTLKGRTLDASEITLREIRLAVPITTNNAQWQQLVKAKSYADTKGIKLTIEQVK
ncbi:hypothetical protein ACRQ5F_24225, partial [Endozoicomonas acroporae]